MYASGLVHPTREVSRSADLLTENESSKVSSLVSAQESGNVEEVMLLKRWNGKLLAESFNLPGMELEIERAVEQVEKSLKLEAESKALRDGQSVEDNTQGKQPVDRKDRS